MMIDADVTDGRGKANSITLLRHTSENDQSNRGPQVDMFTELLGAFAMYVCHATVYIPYLIIFTQPSVTQNLHWLRCEVFSSHSTLDHNTRGRNNLHIDACNTTIIQYKYNTI